MTEVRWDGLVRTAENGGRRSRTLRPKDVNDESVQVQAKVATISGGDADGDRYLQIRWWTEESESWTHLLIDPGYPGLAAVQSVGHGRTETESWARCSESFFDATGIKL
jgi:hypothetical protein